MPIESTCCWTHSGATRATQTSKSCWTGPSTRASLGTGHILGSGLPEEFATLDYRVKLSLAASKADGDLAWELLLELRSVRDSFVESAAR